MLLLLPLMLLVAVVVKGLWLLVPLIAGVDLPGRWQRSRCLWRRHMLRCCCYHKLLLLQVVDSFTPAALQFRVTAGRFAGAVCCVHVLVPWFGPHLEHFSRLPSL